MKISVIIPTYNEAEHIRAVIGAVEQHADSQVGEIIVVDGGSDDETADIVGETAARLLESPKTGRAEQMNYGAEYASGGVLYFLHGDTLVPARFARDIQAAVAAGNDAGSFQVRFDMDSKALAGLSVLLRLNIWILRFGDQSLFVTREVFRAVGGFDEELLLMEDNDIARRLAREGTFCVVKNTVVTSAEKFREIGAAKLMWAFIFIQVLNLLGVPQRWLLAFYKKVLTPSD